MGKMGLRDQNNGKKIGIKGVPDIPCYDPGDGGDDDNG